MAFDITLTVTVSIPIDLTFDEKPSNAILRNCALENFLAHPALRSDGDIEPFVDYIGHMPSKLDVTKVCEACDGKGWLLRSEDGFGPTRIIACDDCDVFPSHDDAVTYVASKALGLAV